MANGNGQIEASLTTEDRLLVNALAEDIVRRLLLLPKLPLREITMEQVRWLLTGDRTV